jgi:hypothetical protein
MELDYNIYVDAYQAYLGNGDMLWVTSEAFQARLQEAGYTWEGPGFAPKAQRDIYIAVAASSAWATDMDGVSIEHNARYITAYDPHMAGGDGMAALDGWERY